MAVFAETTLDAVQEHLSTVKEDENDDETIRVATESSGIDTSIFDGFTDFALDLTCLSPPSSPHTSTSHLPLEEENPSPPISPILSRSISFAAASPTPLVSTLSAKKSKKASSPQLSATVPAGSRGSWPLIKYAGRGTPIDRNRRLEWGGFSGEEVAEDGALFSAARSTSLDSNAIRPSQRSLSPDWHYSSMSSSLSASTHSETMSNTHNSRSEPPPELAPLEALGLNKPEEWDSIMKTVLSPTREEEPPTPTDTTEADEDLKDPGPSSSDAIRKDGILDVPLMTPEQLEQMNNGLEIDLGIDTALDLGLGKRGGMNLFDLGLLPGSSSGRESPSLYSSQMVTPRASPPASVRASEHRSATSTKAGAIEADANGKSHVPRWWQRMVLRIRQVHNIMTIHKNRF